MALPNNALVLVADGRKMLFFRITATNQIDLRTEAHDERDDAKDSEMKPTRRAGRRAPALPAKHEETDLHKQARTIGSRTPPTN